MNADANVNAKSSILTAGDQEGHRQVIWPPGLEFVAGRNDGVVAKQGSSFFAVVAVVVGFIW